MRVRPKRGTPRLRHADTDPYPLRLLSIGDIGSRTRRRRLTGKRTLSMCRSSYQPLRSGSASEAILSSGDLVGGHALAHMSPGAPRRRLVPQPAPPCRGPFAGVQHRRRLRASGVGCSLAPSPTAPSPSASRRAKRSRLRVSLRRHQGDACALPPGALRHGPTEQRPPGQSLLRPRTAAAVAAAAPPFPSVCLVCESVLSVTLVPASCVSPPRLRLCLLS